MRKQTTPLAQPTAKTATPAPVMTGGRPVATSMPYQLIPSEDEIRLRAYMKWEAAGKPTGDGTRFWLEAERELKAGK